MVTEKLSLYNQVLESLAPYHSFYSRSTPVYLVSQHIKLECNIHGFSPHPDPLLYEDTIFLILHLRDSSITISFKNCDIVTSASPCKWTLDFLLNRPQTVKQYHLLHSVPGHCHSTGIPLCA